MELEDQFYNGLQVTSVTENSILCWLTMRQYWSLLLVMFLKGRYWGHYYF